MNDETLKNALQRQPHQNLYDLVDNASRQTDSQAASPQAPSQDNDPSQVLSAHALVLGSDILNYPESTYRQRIKRLKLSVRQTEAAGNELIARGMTQTIWVGKMMFMAPLPPLYSFMDLPCPYKRNVSIEHSFLTLVAQKLLQTWPLVKTTRLEYPLPGSSATVDLLVITQNGDRIAYEVTLSASNICANAAKLRNRGLSAIVFLCRDYDLKDAVWASIRGAGFDADFLSMIRCMIFSGLLKETRTFTLKERP